MCLRSSVLSLLLVLIGFAGPAPAEPTTAPDPIEAYLIERGFADLLALHWENRLPQTRGEERAALLRRLAGVYGDLLARAADEEARSRWERKARRLLPEMGEVEATTLHLGLIRARFLPAESTAERQRLRLAEPTHVDQAKRDLAAILQELIELDRLLKERVSFLQSAAQRPGARGERAAEVLASLSELHAAVRFYQGWSLYYRAMLEAEQRYAYEGMLAFGQLLGQEQGRVPSLRLFPADRMRFEMQARAAIGVALCLSLRGETNEAIRWLDAVAGAEDVHENIIEQLPLRRLIVLGEGGLWHAFGRTRAELERQRELTALETRLIAVLALESNRSHTDDLAVAEASLALARLGDAGQLAHLVDLVRIYGGEALGATSFIGRFVKGLDSYQRARELHQRRGSGDRPSEDTAVIDRYRPAIQYLRSALDSDDADRFPEAQRSARRHLGLSLYFSSRFVEATGIFEDTRGLGSLEAEQFLHLAILALEGEIRRREVRGEPIAEALDELRRVIDVYLERFSGGESVQEVLVKKATLGGLPAEESLRILLEVPSGDLSYEQARRHAARLLWNMYSQAPQFDRPALAQRYLRVATPLLAIDRDRGEAGEAQAQRLFVARAQRVLTAAMTFGLEDRATARVWLAALEVAQSQNWQGTETLASELILRRTQLLTAAGEIEEAAQRVVYAREDGAGDPYLSAAARRVYDSALLAWQADPDNHAALDIVLRFGEMLILDAGGAERAATALGRPILQTLAQAHAHVSRTDDSEIAAKRAMELYSALTEAGLGSADIHRDAARLAEELGEMDEAFASWQAVLAYLHAGATPWFEARYHVLRLLSSIDPQAAAAALEQHRTLYPDYGPEPWGDLIRRLHDRLPVASHTEGERG